MMNQNNFEPTLYQRRKLAKAGMAIALGTLVATGFMAYSSSNRGKLNKSRASHITAGVALVGLSYWHWSLYQR